MKIYTTRNCALNVTDHPGMGCTKKCQLCLDGWFCSQTYGTIDIMCSKCKMKKEEMRQQEEDTAEAELVSKFFASFDN